MSYLNAFYALNAVSFTFIHHIIGKICWSVILNSLFFIFYFLFFKVMRNIWELEWLT